MSLVYFRPPPVRFHSDCTHFDTKFNRCGLKHMKVQSQELACNELELRFTESYERFKCAHCNRYGPNWNVSFIRTEFSKDGSPIDIYKCDDCSGLIMLYQTETTQHCRVYTD